MFVGLYGGLTPLNRPLGSATDLHIQPLNKVLDRPGIAKWRSVFKLLAPPTTLPNAEMFNNPLYRLHRYSNPRKNSYMTATMPGQSDGTQTQDPIRKVMVPHLIRNIKFHDSTISH